MTVSFREAPIETVSDVCGMCLLDISEDIVAHVNRDKKLIHHFHGRCVKPWIQDHLRCPICNIALSLKIRPIEEEIFELEIQRSSEAFGSLFEKYSAIFSYRGKSDVFSLRRFKDLYALIRQLATDDRLIAPVPAPARLCIGAALVTVTACTLPKFDTYMLPFCGAFLGGRYMAAGMTELLCYHRRS